MELYDSEELRKYFSQYRFSFTSLKDKWKTYTVHPETIHSALLFPNFMFHSYSKYFFLKVEK